MKQYQKWKAALPEAKFVNLYGPTEGTGVGGRRHQLFLHLPLIVQQDLIPGLVVDAPCRLNLLQGIYIGPRYMIPNHICRLERMPLTANGKVDRVTLKSNYQEGKEK